MNNRIETKKLRRATAQTYNLVESVSGRGGVLYIFRDSILVG